MTAHQFLTSSRVFIVAGKGGVGKSTISAALALVSARAGLRTLHISLEASATPLPAHDLLSHSTIRPGTALSDYLAARGMGLLSRQLANSGLIELVASTAPGIDDLLVLGKIKSLAKDSSNDVIIVDGPAAGHALDLLRTPTELRAAVGGGPIRQQADDVLSMLADAAMCRLILVTTPAMTPVSETIEAATSITRDIGIALGPVVVNMCDESPAPVDTTRLSGSLRDAYEYATVRGESQRTAIAALASTRWASAPVPHVTCSRHRLDGLPLVEALSSEVSGALDDPGATR